MISATMDARVRGGTRVRSAGTGDAWAPLLLATLGGSLVAGRFETALGCVGFGAAAAFALGAGRPRARWLTMLAISLATALVLNLYLVAGHPIALPHVFGAIPTREGLRLGLLLGLRLLGAALAVRALAALWPGERAADELAGLMRPLERIGIPIEEARAVVGLALRFVPLLAEETGRIARLQTLRAGRPPRDLGERLTRLRARVVPSLVGALERAEQVALALEARHHRGSPARPGRWPRAATLAAVAMFLAVLLWRD